MKPVCFSPPEISIIQKFTLSLSVNKTNPYMDNKDFNELVPDTTYDNATMSGTLLIINDKIREHYNGNGYEYTVQLKSPEFIYDNNVIKLEIHEYPKITVGNILYTIAEILNTAEIEQLIKKPIVVPVDYTSRKAPLLRRGCTVQQQPILITVQCGEDNQCSDPSHAPADECILQRHNDPSEIRFQNQPRQQRFNVHVCARICLLHQEVS